MSVVAYKAQRASLEPKGLRLWTAADEARCNLVSGPVPRIESTQVAARMAILPVDRFSEEVGQTFHQPKIGRLSALK